MTATKPGASEPFERGSRDPNWPVVPVLMERRAYHEAGHAVVARAYHFELSDVWISNRPSDPGGCEYGRPTRLVAGDQVLERHSPDFPELPPDEEARFEQACAELQIAIAMAGRLAHQITKFPTDSTEYLRDDHDIGSLSHGSPRMRHAGHTKALAVLHDPRYWHAVEALAATLQQRWRLSGPEAERIITAAMGGDRPEPAPEDGSDDDV